MTIIHCILRVESLQSCLHLCLAQGVISANMELLAGCTWFCCLASVYLQALYVSPTNIQIITILSCSLTQMQTPIYCLPKQEGETCAQISIEPWGWRKLVYLVRVTHCVNVKFLQTMLE